MARSRHSRRRRRRIYDCWTIDNLLCATWRRIASAESTRQ